MINKILEEMFLLRNDTKQYKPLVHCITNPISIHDCANIILATGARPIMAEHPFEVEQITGMSQALVLNLGNITDVRMESMKRSFSLSVKEGIPSVLDLVGIACSDLRKDYVKELLQCGNPDILKGNMSEMLMMSGLPSHSIGVDSGDLLSEENEEQIFQAFSELSCKTKSVLLISGKQDIIVHKNEIYIGENGTENLASITGTGCMLGALCGSYLMKGSPFLASVLAVSTMGIAGELASVHFKGPGTFQNELLDAVYQLNEEQFQSRIKLKKREGKKVK